MQRTGDHSICSNLSYMKYILSNMGIMWIDPAYHNMCIFYMKAFEAEAYCVILHEVARLDHGWLVLLDLIIPRFYKPQICDCECFFECSFFLSRWLTLECKFFFLYFSVFTVSEITQNYICI